MTPRRRRRDRQDLPPNLYLEGRYFRYRRPTDGRRFGMGTDRKRAAAAAMRLNAIYAESEGLVGKVSGAGGTLNAFLDGHFREIEIDRELAPVTRRDYEQKLVHIRQALGHQRMSEITVLEVAGFVDGFPSTQSNRYRALLSLIFRYAVAKGWCSTNPALQTIPKREKVIRQRLDLDGFKAIRAKAPIHIANAMDLALHTLQRREDVSRLRWEQWQGDVLEIIQGKTGAPLRIHVDPPLRAVLQRCRDEMVSQWIIHQPYSAGRRRRGNQVRPETLSRGFQIARAAAGAYEHLAQGQRPTFHEIRALGARLYRDAGIDPQPLLGHKDHRMTEVYLSRHETRWIEVTGGLDL